MCVHFATNIKKWKLYMNNEDIIEELWIEKESTKKFEDYRIHKPRKIKRGKNILDNKSRNKLEQQLKSTSEKSQEMTMNKTWREQICMYILQPISRNEKNCTKICMYVHIATNIRKWQWI